MTVGGRIRQLREERGISLSRLAEEAGLSKGYLSALERDEQSNPSLDAVAKLAGALGVTSVELIEGSGERESKPRALPEGLEEFLRQQEAKGLVLSDAEVAMLQGIRFRGKRPKTAEDWAFLFEAIRRVSR